MGWRRPTSLGAFIWHLTSTLAAACVLLTQPHWLYCIRLSTDHSTLGDRSFPSSAHHPHMHGMEQLAFRLVSEMHRHWRRSAATWRLYRLIFRSSFMPRSHMTPGNMYPERATCIRISYMPMSTDTCRRIKLLVRDTCGLYLSDIITIHLCHSRLCRRYKKHVDGDMYPGVNTALVTVQRTRSSTGILSSFHVVL